MAIDIIFIDPPFVDINNPAFGLSLLKSNIEHHSPYSVKILYANLDFSYIAKKYNIDYFDLLNWNYKTLYTYRCCESIFLEDDNLFNQYITFLIQKNQNQQLINNLVNLRKLVPIFLFDMMEKIKKYEPKIIGCTNNFTQTNASLKLLKLCKQKNKQYLTILGGYNCLHCKDTFLQYSFIDECISGECDTTIVDIIDNLLVNKKYEEKSLRDMSYVMPDYKDYIEQYAQYYNHKITLFYELSRGCDYAYHNKKCTFCLLDNDINTYRHIPIEVFTKNINNMYYDYKIRNFFLTDLMVQKKLLNKDWSLDSNINLLCHIRPDLDIKTICHLRKNNIKIVMCGIETLSEFFLQQFNKGSSIIHIIELLKFLHINGIHVLWYIIQNIPLEKIQDYEDMLNIIPYICHFYPPTDIVDLRYETNSIYKKEQKRYDINLIKNESIFLLYDNILKNKIHCNYEDLNKIDDNALISIQQKLSEQINIWQDRFFNRENLCILQKNIIIDSRNSIKQIYEISFEEEKIIKLCYTKKTLSFIKRHFSNDITHILMKLQNKKLIYIHNDKCISLPIIKQLYGYEKKENLPYVL